MSHTTVAAEARFHEVEEAGPPAVPMDEESFRGFYERTARPLRAYLLRMTRDLQEIDDMLQEAYLRLLRAQLPATMQEEHRKNYLYKVATNLVRDAIRAHRVREQLAELPCPSQAGELDARRDMNRLLDRLKPRERQLLWLAYVERFSHREIAGALSTKPQSIRPMLARARARLAALLRGES